MIYTVTLNPALDRELSIPALAFDSVLRATEARVDYGGKGFNVSRMLAVLGAESVALGFAGGHTGAMLRDGLAALSIETDFVRIAGETRTNVSIVMADAATLMAPDGMLVLFAGVPNGTLAPLNLSAVYLHNAQFTGTSGSTLDDQATVIRKTSAHELSPNRSVAAIGGMDAARDGIRAMMEGRYPGKIVIFPQISGLPLIGLAELKDAYPDVASRLGPGDVWTPAAEHALIERFWQP